VYRIHNGAVQTPPGFDKLNSFSFNNISLNVCVRPFIFADKLLISRKDVFLSSIKAYEAAQFNYNNVKGQRWADAMNWGVGNRPIDQWAFFEGVFTVPVCSDSAGSALTSPGAKKSFPCSCGSNNGDQTGPFRVSLPICKFRLSKSNMRQLSGRIST
jgi:hypothetical protein